MNKQINVSASTQYESECFELRVKARVEEGWDDSTARSLESFVNFLNLRKYINKTK